MAWRTTPGEARHHSGAERKPMMESRVNAGTTVSLVGYLAGEPVAWVSIASRETYRELGGLEAESGFHELRRAGTHRHVMRLGLPAR